MILNCHMFVCVCGVSQHIRSAKAETGFSPCPESSDASSRRLSFISILLKRRAVYPITRFILGFCTQSSVWLPSATIKDETVSDPERAARDFTRWGVTRGSEVNLCNSGICIQMTNDRIFLVPPTHQTFNVKHMKSAVDSRCLGRNAASSEVGAPCFTLISSAGQRLHLLNFITVFVLLSLSL